MYQFLGGKWSGSIDSLSEGEGLLYILLSNVKYLIKSHDPQNISHQQIERILCAGTKVSAMNGTHDVRITIQKLHKRFQTPKEAFHTAHNCSRHNIIVFFQLLIDVLQNASNYPDNRQNERSKRQRSQVISYRNIDATCQREKWYVLFGKGPVPGGKRCGQHHFTEGRNEKT